MWRGRKGSGGREVFKAACGRREAAGGCGFGGWVERGGWGGRGACEAGKRRTWRRPRRSCPVEERGQRGALGPRCSRRPAKAVRLGAGAAATTYGLMGALKRARKPAVEPTVLAWPLCKLQLSVRRLLRACSRSLQIGASEVQTIGHACARRSSARPVRCAPIGRDARTD